MEDWQHRIEAKIDKLSDAVISMARIEERMITLFKRMDIYDERQNEIGKRIGNIEKVQAGNAWIERLIWVLIGSLAAGIAWFK